VSRPPRITGFWVGDEWHELREPDAEATAHQLRLNRDGRLEVVNRTAPISKNEAAAAIETRRETHA
jgi:hypothetical protein